MILAWGVIGVVVGGLVAGLLSLRKTQSLRQLLSVAESRVLVAEALHRASEESLERERADHAQAVANLETLFEATSSRVLVNSMT